ncbi:MAG: hypothetical protein R6X12_02920, partial [bacterium]
GCLAGGREDRRPAALSFPESHGHRADWTVGGALLGGIAGYTFFLLAGPTLFGRIEWVDRVVNDKHGFAALPAFVAGIGMAVDAVYLGYVLGRAIDRRNDRARAADLDRRLQALLDLQRRARLAEPAENR